MLSEKGLLERQALKNQKVIVGIDEVGRGCLAGPVFAAAVILDLSKLFNLSSAKINLIRDSKKLSAKQRREALEILEHLFISRAVASSSVKEVEDLGIVDACFLAMKRSINQLTSDFNIIYVDGNKKIPQLHYEQEAIIKGDNSVYSIAAASILAKQKRDDFMLKTASKYPAYEFENNVGYGTKNHLEAIKTFGACPLHRKNFAPMKNMQIL